MSIQRFLSTRDAAAARKTLLVSQLADVSVSLLLAITGIALFGFYIKHPDRMGSVQSMAESGDQLFPQFIMRELPPGVSGLVLAAILSAALSSLSSGINSICAVIERDFLERKRVSGENTADPVHRLRILTVLVAAIAVALSFLNLLFVGNLLERCFKVINLLTAPLFMLFFLALFVRKANPTGAWCGLVLSVAVAVLIAYSTELQLPFQISFVWMMPCSLSSGIITASLVSLLFPRTTVVE